mmetsp:Transcript_153009/g.490874  ORF Transcript_153009/g.490874 Transcript_153009/m.490874 type:complete len:201 (-) Transcript_153009:462-1064(-)
MTSESSPGRRAQAASSSSGSKTPRSTGPRSPPCEADASSENSRASSTKVVSMLVADTNLFRTFSTNTSSSPFCRLAAGSSPTAAPSVSTPASLTDASTSCPQPLIHAVFVSRKESTPLPSCTTAHLPPSSAVPQAASTRCTTLMPSSTRPKTTCLRSSCLAAFKRMKNCEPLEFGPALAMLSSPSLECDSKKFSSSNRSP